MRTLVALGVLALALGFVAPEDSQAQEPSEFLAVGQEAPDIELVGATRYGVLTEPVRLSQFRGETVVLAFFFRARTRG
jgi:peroxiredoxin Q/BCP